MLVVSVSRRLVGAGVLLLSVGLGWLGVPPSKGLFEMFPSLLAEAFEALADLFEERVHGLSLSFAQAGYGRNGLVPRILG